jgi:hypothetical protein
MVLIADGTPNGSNDFESKEMQPKQRSSGSSGFSGSGSSGFSGSGSSGFSSSEWWHYGRSEIDRQQQGWSALRAI